MECIYPAILAISHQLANSTQGYSTVESTVLSRPPEPQSWWRRTVVGHNNVQPLNLWMPSSHQMSPLSSLRSSPISSLAIMKLDPSTPHPLPQLLHIMHISHNSFQRRGCRRRAPGSQTRCLSSCSDSVCHQSRHRRSGRSAMLFTSSPSPP